VKKNAAHRARGNSRDNPANTARSARLQIRAAHLPS
jgi:hypothetical protein